MKDLEALVYEEIFFNFFDGRTAGRTSIEISRSMKLPLTIIQVQIRALLKKGQIERSDEKMYIPARFTKMPITPPEHSRKMITFEFEHYPGEYREHPERDPLQQDEDDGLEDL